MGIESDQVVYEYLSRVGDVAQQRQLPSATRMSLVARLRDEIDRRRARAAVDSPAAVRRIISRMGTPDEVVAAATGPAGAAGTDGADPRPDGAAGATAGRSAPPPAAVPTQRSGDRSGRARGVLRRAVPRPRPAGDPRPAPASVTDAPSPPHQAGTDELGDSANQPDWWRVDSSPFGVGDEVTGFVGGVEIPELLKPPPLTGTEGAAAESTAPAAAVETETPAPRRRLLRLPSGGWSNPLLLLAAGLLVVGAVLGSLPLLALGWLVAYLSRRLTPAQAKWAVLGLPGLVAAVGVVWLWGRTDGRWGDPIARGHMNDAVAETWPWVLRGAAVASAFYLVWRARRSRG
ncbi:hypothetical protein WJ438_22575 [Streptomyces sp. GD-15H]|uniref:hypothetical protein n=1 Tax=Streptomyces sp. GD-15H TaxID=3129112 RepID=UPI00324CC6A0